MSDEAAKGVFMGLACGDALGRPVEFESTDEIESEYGRLSEMEGFGRWGKSPGTLTDDTDQALCIAWSLVECGTFDPEDIANRFVEWYETGPFDVGILTQRAIKAIARGRPWDVSGQAIWENQKKGAMQETGV